MAALVWDKVGDRSYETGVSKGVLYQEDRTGIPWNGLTSIDESSDNSTEPVYFDGSKFNDIVTLGDYTANMKAFTYPEEFLHYEGTVQDQSGFYIQNQPPSQFGLSYQTKVGDDVVGVDAGYKIHILYNLTAVPSSRSFQTIGDQLDPLEFEWTITSIPEELENFHPTAHVFLDSRKINPYLLLDVEEILYGTETTDPYLPSLKTLSTFIRNWNRFMISFGSNGIWIADAKDEGIITMLDDTTFQITSDTAEFIDADTYTISSSARDEEDMWLP